MSYVSTEAIAPNAEGSVITKEKGQKCLTLQTFPAHTTRLCADGETEIGANGTHCTTQSDAVASG